MTKAEANAKIAELVMGWTLMNPEYFDKDGVSVCHRADFSPTTDPVASKQLREKLGELGCWTLAWIPRHRKFVFTIFRNDEDKPDLAAEATTEELAAAQCALRAHGIEGEIE